MPVIVLWKHFELFCHYNSVSLWGKNLTPPPPPLFKGPPKKKLGGGGGGVGERFEFSIKPIGMASALFKFTDLCIVLGQCAAENVEHHDGSR